MDGTPAEAGLLVVNDFGTQIGLEGEVVARPRDGLTLVRVPAAPHVSSLAEGLYYDGWARGNLRYRTWPADAGPGAYRVVAVAAGGRRRARGHWSRSKAAPGAPSPSRAANQWRSRCPPTARRSTLHVTSNRAEILDGGTASPRIVSFRVDRLEYLPGARFTRTASRSGVLGL